MKVPDDRVSRNSKIPPENWSSPKVAQISYTNTGASCSCGWSYGHHRLKVVDDAIDRHLAKRHGGVGIRW